MVIPILFKAILCGIGFKNLVEWEKMREIS